MKFIKISQLLSIGGGLINSLGNGFIMFYTAYLTLDSTISIGEMAAIQLITGQLTSTISNIIGSASTIQETKFSIERILETQALKEEESGDKKVDSSSSISLKNVTFSYTDLSDKVLNNISFTIESMKSTAIVGISGSGKTTIMKLVLGLIEPRKGDILIDNSAMSKFDINNWRSKCGVVMQEGYLFTDSIMNNVTMSDDKIDYDKYIESLKLAAIFDFVNALPIQHKTIIGNDGLALSSGQRQRILIARMFYKDPDYIFLDEATNSLDSETEMVVMGNLNKAFSNKTRLFIAHRLNTVKHADKIIVLDKGKIIEEGNHNELIKKNGFYYNLVKEQINYN